MKGGGLLGFILKALGLGFLALILGATTAAIVIHVVGTITRQKLKEELQKKGITSAVVTGIARSHNQVTLEDVVSRKVLTFQGDGISDDLHKKDRIYV